MRRRGEPSQEARTARRPVSRWMTVVWGGCLCLAAWPARGDVVRLAAGGELRGEIDRSVSGPDGESVTIETLNGVVVTVDRDDVAFVNYRRLIVEQYERRAEQTPDDLESQWSLAEWCRENGLSRQRKSHLRRVVEFEPDHEEARRALRHVKYKGRWMPRDEAMALKGYVRHGRRYVTPQELDLIKKTEWQRDAEREWYKKVRMYHGWTRGRDTERHEEGVAALRKIDDPLAIPALERHLSDSASARTRMLYVEILAGMPPGSAVAQLADRSLHDEHYEIRFRALQALDQQAEAAIPHFVEALESDLNKVVRRAGKALGRIGTERVVPHLIEALVTRHQYYVRKPTKQGSYSFRTDGSFGSPGRTVLPPRIEALLRTGQLPNGVIVNRAGPQPPPRTRVVKVSYDHRNEDVRLALVKLTGADHGFDERTWRLWWSARQNGLLDEAG